MLEHAYLKYKLDNTVGLKSTRSKHIRCNQVNKSIYVAQGADLAELSDNLSKVLKVYKKPQAFDVQEETIQINDFCVSSDYNFVAIGYSNSEIYVFDISGEEICHFIGHRSPISTLVFNDDSNILASGSQDNDIVIWDIGAETGICRLVGHKNVVADIVFIPDTTYLLSCSKDTHIRVWDVELQTCVQILTTSTFELYSMLFVGDNTVVVAGRSETFLTFHINDPDKIDHLNPIVLSLDSQYNRGEESIAQNIAISKSGKVAFINNNKVVDIYQVLSTEEMDKKAKRRLKRAQKTGSTPQKVEKFELDQKINTIAKVINGVFLGELLVLSLADNSIFVYELSKAEGEDKASFKVKYQTSSHNTDIRGVTFIYQQVERNEIEDFQEQIDKPSESKPKAIIALDRIASVSDGQCKVWDFGSQQCVMNIPCHTATALSCLPGGRFIIIGTDNGLLQMVDLQSAELYKSYEAHSGRIWAITYTPRQFDRSSQTLEIATCSSDNSVKFWSISAFEHKIALVHKRTLKLSDECLNICYSVSGSYIACALIDNTVRVFHTDTLNFFISLYGSAGPVTCIDFSDDDSLIITGGSDKNLRIWGAEYGDCHRSLFAHDATLVSCKFIENTHLCVTAGRDGLVKFWDCDRFKCVQRLRSHIDAIFALDISPHGNFVVTGGRDKGLRIWKRTNEQLYTSNEEDISLEQRLEAENAERRDRTVLQLRGSIFGGSVRDTASRLSVETIRNSDNLRDNIDLVNKEVENPGSPVFANISPDDYLLNQLKRINRADIDPIVQSLPFSYIVQVIKWSEKWLEQDKEVELVIRLILSIIKFHESQLLFSTEMNQAFKDIKEAVHEKVEQIKSRCGSNLAALKMISREMKRIR